MFDLPQAGPALAFVLALVTIVWFDRATRRRGLDPPGFGQPARRALGLAGLGLVLWMAAFAPAFTRAETPASPADFAGIPTARLFAVHALLVLAMGLWFGAGYLGLGRAGPAAAPGVAGGAFARQFGLRAARPLREAGLGIAVGLSTWSLLLGVVLVIVLALQAVWGDDIVPRQPPAAIPFLASLPALLRLALSLSAGVVEEVFFRGLLQPRVGVVLSTALFALAHAGYGQPLMLIGITLLSLLYAAVVRWRQSLWAAMAAHATFDAVQLLIVIPNVLDLLGPGGGAAGDGGGG